MVDGRWQVMCESCGHKSEPCKAMPPDTNCCDKPNFTLVECDIPRPGPRRVPVAICLYAAMAVGPIPEDFE